jgi:Protein of unknown function (DUF3592)
MKTLMLVDPLLALIDVWLALPTLWVEWLVLGVAGLGLIHYARVLRKKLPSRWLARTSGRILKVDLRKTRKRQDDGSIVYQPVVQYDYEVGGRVLQGWRISSENSVGALTWGLKMMKAFQPGTEVPVFYHPERPHEAVLQVTSLRYYAVCLALCALFLVWGSVRLLWV